MKKKILLRAALRAVLGLPLGIALGNVITVLISVQIGDGNYYPCVPSLVEELGGELNAVIVQTLLCALLGGISAAASAIWELERSIALRTGVFFLVMSLAMMPIAYLLHWMERSPMGFLIYFAIFAAIFAAIWLTIYLISLRTVKKLNQRLK